MPEPSFLPPSPYTRVRDVVAAHAPAAERERRLSPQAVRALTEAGLVRFFVPEAFGGAGGGFTGLLHAVTEVSQGCAAAGWCASLFASHARMAAFLPLAGQKEVWAGGPDALISAAIVPSGTAEAVPGGWRLSGEWGFVSGVDFADWALLSAREPGEEGRLRFFAVPSARWTVRDTWFSVGLRGTGSRTVVLDSVFVPGHRSFLQQALLEGAAVAAGPQGPARCHRVPFRLVSGLSLMAPALGAARAGLDAFGAGMRTRTETLMGRRVRSRDKESVHCALARAAAALDAAELLLARTAGVADGDAPVGAEQVARSQRDCAVAAEWVTDAVELLQRTAGARAQGSDHPLQRAWRDVHAATSHAALQLQPNAAVYARQVLGGDAPPAA
ncbi:acyl-CoA dehydrogenase family protein [Streptomyces sp. NPDC006193]|uniref:acyl-CoA dehydrogenase family protein n=1 Tax=Streptomyces sp. NPDC006193 TaxID=3155717 RepID=UPI0033B53329